MCMRVALYSIITMGCDGHMLGGVMILMNSEAAKIDVECHNEMDGLGHHTVGDHMTAW